MKTSLKFFVNQTAKLQALNTFMPNRLSDPYQLEECITNSRVALLFIKSFILVANSGVPDSDTAFCGVWPGSAPFTYVPQKGRFVYISIPDLCNLTYFK